MENYFFGDASADQQTVGTADGPKVKRYDFKHPKLVSKEVMRILHNIHELYSRNLNRIFTDSLSQKIDIQLQGIEEVIFSEFLGELEPPTALFLFNIEELGDWALMEMDPSFCLYCIERQSGSREETTKPARALTRIEERVISRIMNRIFKELSHVWSSYLDITIVNHVYESKPANVRTISSHIPGIIIRYQIKVQDIVVPFKICYPYALLKEQMSYSLHEPESKPAGEEGLDVKQKKTFERYMKKVYVPVQVVLGRANVTMQDLMQIEEGDVIKLDQPIDEPLDVLINGSKKMKGYPGNMSGKRAIKIFEIRNS